MFRYDGLVGAFFFGDPRRSQDLSASLLPVLPIKHRVHVRQVMMKTRLLLVHANFNRITGGPGSLLESRRGSCLQAVLCYKRLFTKVCMGCKRFVLKERKNFMFLKKSTYLIASLLIARVSRRFEAFSASWRYFGVPLLRGRQDRTAISGASVARGK